MSTKVKVKICGMQGPADLTLVNQSGADYCGFVFASSHRQVAASTVSIWLKHTRFTNAVEPVGRVGVFVNHPVETVINTASRCDLDVVQLHGNEPPSVCHRLQQENLRVWKTLKLRRPRDIRDIEPYRETVDAVLLDTPVADQHGGTGETFDWDLAVRVRRRWPELKVVLAGGLTPDNVAGAIDTVDPWAVDVSSGVERADGRSKDPAAVRRFIQNTRNTEHSKEVRSK